MTAAAFARVSGRAFERVTRSTGVPPPPPGGPPRYGFGALDLRRTGGKVLLVCAGTGVSYWLLPWGWVYDKTFGAMSAALRADSARAQQPPLSAAAPAAATAAAPGVAPAVAPAAAAVPARISIASALAASPLGSEAVAGKAVGAASPAPAVAVGAANVVPAVAGGVASPASTTAPPARTWWQWLGCSGASHAPGHTP